MPKGLKPDVEPDPEGAPRGSSWRNYADVAWVAVRGWHSPNLRIDCLGLRLVRDNNHHQGEQHEKEE